AVSTVAAPVASVELHVNEPTVAVGERVTLHAICRDADGNELAERPARWTSSDHAVAQVSEDGTVYVIERGAVTIGAEIDGVSGRTQLYVSRVAVSALQIHGRVRDFAVGDEIQLGVDVADRSGSRLGGRVIAWTSTDPRVARISRTGLLTALTEGWTTILASNGAARASVDVQVTPTTVAAFRLQPVASTLRLGEAWRFSALATNLRGRPVEGLEVTWASSDSSIAVVGADGVVTALRPGTVKIAAAIKGRRATAAVTVVRATRSAEG
ncbi:MAG: Ig-like domain-containing protein, partial [Gemmatimonadaceae bacterium]|nr:Ig-like domain-containing protein [Gemmatimonadaceae bacterium]